MNRREVRRQFIEAIATVELARVVEIADSHPSIVNAANSHGNVPLSDAISTGSLDVVKLLVARGADMFHRNHGGHGPLDGAAFFGRPDIARYLIARGVQPTVHHAAAIGDIPLLKRMTSDEGACLDVQPAGGRWRLTPLHAAVLGGSHAAVEYLLSIDAPVDPVNHNGHTALAMVTECRSRDSRVRIARALLAHGAEVNAAAGHHGGTVLHRAVMDGDHGLAFLLLHSGADPNRRDWSGKTPLHHAVSKNRRLVELLLGYSPDVSVASRAGETAAQLARRLGKKAVVRLIEVAG